MDAQNGAAEALDTLEGIVTLPRDSEARTALLNAFEALRKMTGGGDER